MKAINFRKAEISDVEKIYNLEKELANGYSLKTITESLCSDNYINIVVILDDKIIGYVSFSYLFDTAELIKIVIGSEYRKRGVATKLIEYSTKLLIDLGVDTIFLEVNEKNLSAIALYEKLRYEKYSIRKKYYGFDNAVLYRKILK